MPRSIHGWSRSRQARSNPSAPGRVASERTSLAELDGENGIPPLILERAAELAVEKARESGVGLVRITGIRPVMSAAPIAAGIAIGPMAGWVLGPGSAWSLALPTAAGLPLVVNPTLPMAAASGKPDPSARTGGRPAASSRPMAGRRDEGIPAPALPQGLGLAAEWLVPAGGWLVGALSNSQAGSHSAAHDRVTAAVGQLAAAPSVRMLAPDDWEADRRRLWHEGLEVSPAAWKSLVHRAHRLAIDVPAPLEA